MRAATEPARFASLPMYDLPELRAATDALWRDIAERLERAGVDGVPASLVRDDAHDLIARHWRHPRLLLSQACGWPLVTALDGDVAVVGTFAYAGVSTGDGRYASCLVVRADDRERPLAGRSVAVNAYDSLSGWVSLCAAVGDPDDVGPVTITGGHVDSVRAVQTGAADLASIDAVTWELLARHRPGARDGLVIVGAGPVVPGLPLVTHPSLGPGVDALRTALADVRSDPLLVDGFVPLDAADYAPVRDLTALRPRDP